MQGEGMMKISMVLAIPICLGLGSQVMGDWAYEMTSEKCSPAARKIVATSTRNQIENSVRRAEASIDAPTPIGDLSCLAGLMQLPLGSFASTGNLGSIFGSTLQSLINPNGNVINQYCARAEREWRKATRSLGRNSGSLIDFKLPSYFQTRTLQASTGQYQAGQQPMDGAGAASSIGNGNNTNQVMPVANSPPNNGTPQGVPLEADQSIEGIWDTIYGKESDQ